MILLDISFATIALISAYICLNDFQKYKKKVDLFVAFLSLFAALMIIIVLAFER